MNLLSTSLLAQIKKEFLSVLRDPKARMILVGPPLMQLLVFSFAATLEVTNSSVVYLDHDNGRWSQELQYRLQQSSFVDDLIVVYNEREFRQVIDNREALIGIRVPDDFSRQLFAGDVADLQVIGDGRRANSSQVATGYVQTIANELGAQINNVEPTDIAAIRHWFNPNLTYRWFVVPSLAGILSMFIALMVTSLSIARERELGTFDQLLVSPSNSLEIIVAKSIPALVIGCLLGSVMITAGIVGFGIKFQGSLLFLFLSAICFILSVIGIGLVISSVCDTQQQAILGAFALAVPMTLMSGFATPVENMPPFLEAASQLVPLKHFLLVLQGSFLKNMTAMDVLNNTIPMILISIFTLSLAVYFVRSRLQ
ncbi:MAG: ABC transporter permease [Pseudomonadales bacterium]|nr:ABC transporter permease [Pseudomonadales bacterium]